MNIMKPSILTFLGIMLIGSMGIGLYVARIGHIPSGRSLQVASKPVGVGGQSEALNYEDPTILLGDVHNVFVGKVLRQVGIRMLSGAGEPTYQFEVRPIMNVKGNLREPVVLNQFDRRTRKYYPEPLLNPGSTYTFAVRYIIDYDMYEVGPQAWHSYDLLSNDSALSDVDLKRLAEQSPRIKELVAAYPTEQILADPKRPFNSYRTRNYDATGQLIDDTVVMHRQYLVAHPEAANQESQLNEPAPGMSEEPSSTPAEASITVTPTPQQSLAPTETPVPPDETATPVPEEPTPTALPTDTPVQS